MSTFIRSFPVGEVVFLVTYAYAPGTPATYTEPETSPEFVIDVVSHKGEDITELLCACSEDGESIPEDFVERFAEYALAQMDAEAAEALEEARHDE